MNLADEAAYSDKTGECLLVEEYPARNQVGLFEKDGKRWVLKAFKDRPLIDRIKKRDKERVPDVMANSDKYGRYKAEHRKLRALSNTGLVPQFIDRADLVIMMSYIDGIQLSSMKDSSYDHLAACLSDAICTLDNIHLRGIYHGDSRLENILLDRAAGTVVWVDLETPLTRRDNLGCRVNDAILLSDSVRKHFPKHYEMVRRRIGEVFGREVGDIISDMRPSYPIIRSS